MATVFQQHFVQLSLVEQAVGQQVALGCHEKHGQGFAVARDDLADLRSHKETIETPLENVALSK